jgi:hypothetical protein
MPSGARDTLLLYDRPEAMSKRAGAAAGRLGEWRRPPANARSAERRLGRAPGRHARAARGGSRARNRSAVRARRRLRAPARARPGGEGRSRHWLCSPPSCRRCPVSNCPAATPRRLSFRAPRTRRGAVTIVELDYLDNDGLRDAAARALAYQLLAPGLGEGRMQLVYSADVPSLFRLLVEHAWMVLLPLLLALAGLAGLARPALRSAAAGAGAAPAGAARARARRRRIHLGPPARQRAARGRATAVPQRLQRHAPEIDALDGEAQVLALAEATGCRPRACARRCGRKACNIPNSFTQSIATLLQMRSRL